MHVGARDARELRNSIKTAITFPFFNIFLSNLRYNLLLSYLHESTCMHVGARDARALRKQLKLP